jgi:hypothetical protein
MTAAGPLFLLGTHQPGWLAKPQVAAEQVPLFVSDRRLRGYRRLPRAAAPWAVDSGGFTELQRYGRWTVSPAEYVARLRRYRDETGNLMWAAQQDWMCEPIIINGGVANGQRFVGTHLSVPEHQRRTVLNYGHLLDLAPDLDIVPVVQGVTPDEYERCRDLFWRLLRIDLATLPRVGVGSVCRRQGTREVGAIIGRLRASGLHRLHLFGFKTLGLVQPAPAHRPGQRGLGGLVGHRAQTPAPRVGGVRAGRAAQELRQLPALRVDLAPRRAVRGGRPIRPASTCRHQLGGRRMKVISDVDIAELYEALGDPMGAAYFRAKCQPDPDAPTVDELTESITDVIDTVPDKGRGKHADECGKKHAPCLAEKIRELLP